MKAIKAFSLSIFVAILCAACSDAQPKNEQEEPMNFEGFGESVRECSSAWEDLFDDWYREVGSLGPSLLAVQKSIMENGDSEFSQVILSIWNRNEPPSDGRLIWGSWPVSDRAFREQTFIISEGFKHLVPEKCSSASWLYSIIGRALYIGADGNEHGYMVPADAPRESEWGSPALQHWYVFWLFNRHPDLENSAD